MKCLEENLNNEIDELVDQLQQTTPNLKLLNDDIFKSDLEVPDFSESDNVKIELKEEKKIEFF